MKFWETNGVDLYTTYNHLRNKEQWGRLAELVPELMREHPQMVKYIINKIDSCFGEHIVYVVDTNKGIKVGYTKNTIEQRFSEKRYSNSDEFEIIEILRHDRFQAKGALEFENKLKEILIEYSIETDMVMPGKGELYDKVHVDTILSEYDAYKDNYKSIIGLKPPN